MSELKLANLLNTINKLDVPVGASHLSNILSVPPATIGRMLKGAENEGYLQRISNKGRRLTDKGRNYLAEWDLIAEKKTSAEKLMFSASGVSANKLLEILQVRKRLEPYAASLACSNITEEQLDELELIVLKHTLEIKAGKIGNEKDLQLHLALAKCSGNSTIFHILRLLLTEDNVYTTFASVSDMVKGNNPPVLHTEILDAFKSKQPELAAAAMEHHIEKLIENTNQYVALLNC